MTKKYTVMSIILNLIYWIAFHYFNQGIIPFVWVPLLFLIYFCADKGFKGNVKKRITCCVSYVVISLAVYVITQMTSFLDYNPESLSDGLGFAFTYYICLFACNILVPVLMMLVTVVLRIHER